jgi:hypothetical protein
MILFFVPQATERQRVTDQIKSAMIFARADFVNVHTQRDASKKSLRCAEQKRQNPGE